MRFSVRVFLFSIAAFLIALSVASSSNAQTQSAEISGIVTDPQGSAIANAQVSAESIPPAGSPLKGVSASDGRFSLRFPQGAIA
jgi:hypothetical protein